MLSITLALIIAVSARAQDMTATFQQAFEKKLLQIKTSDYSERQVVFQQVRQGARSGGSYQFFVTAMVRDYNAGYPKNRYYGQTCVGRFNNAEMTMSPNGFGQWDIEGRLTPDMSLRTCKDNPAEGQSSFPLASLPGSPAPRGAAAQPAAAAGGGGGGSVATGSYECWANGQARMLLNFTVTGAGRYRDAEGKNGAFTFDSTTARITFRGGLLDGFMPAGFFSMYVVSQGRPRVSFRNSGGSEVTFCERVR